MKKSDLRTGYLVETRDGRIYKVCLGNVTKEGIFDTLERTEGKVNLNSYDDNLIYCKYDNLNQYDIMKVYIPNCFTTKYDLRHCKLLWERESKNNVKDVFNQLSCVYTNAILTMEEKSNGYDFYIYVPSNRRVRQYMDKQKLEKSDFNEVLNILVRGFDKDILNAFKI